MSFVVLATEGFPSQLAALLESLPVSVHLYTNDPPLSPASVAGDFVEPVYAGYVPKALSRWTPPALRGPRAFSQADPVRFQWTSGPAPLPVRGYFATNGIGGPLLWAWRRPDDAFPLGPGSPLLLIAVTIYFPYCPAP